MKIPVKFTRKVLKEVRFHSVSFFMKQQPCTLASGWSLKKGDWWYESGKPETAKFFDIRKTVSKDGLEKYGLYIGRLGLVFMKKAKKKESTIAVNV